MRALNLLANPSSSVAFCHISMIIFPLAVWFGTLWRNLLADSVSTRRFFGPAYSHFPFYRRSFQKLPNKRGGRYPIFNQASGGLTLSSS